jgi:hypothetical protein
LDEVAKNNIEKDSVIFSNISTGYINLKWYFEENIQSISMSFENKFEMK